MDKKIVVFVVVVLGEGGIEVKRVYVGVEVEGGGGWGGGLL